MQRKKTIKLLTFILTLLFLGTTTIFAQEQPEKLDRAVRLFNESNYMQAMPVFRELLMENPENAMLNFYYGASRTENGFFSEKDLSYLLKAQNETVPPKINFYLGMQNHAQGNWNDALKHYNKFRVAATSEQLENLSVAEKIQQCFNQENPYTLTESPEQEDIAEFSSEIGTIPQISQDKPAVADSAKVETTGKTLAENKGEPIEFQVNNEITYLNTSHFKTEKGKNLFEKARSLQKKLDFSLKQMEKLRDEYRLAGIASEREIIGEKILSFETETYQLKEEITELLLKAGNLENEYWQNADPMQVLRFQATIMELAETRKGPTPVVETHPKKSDTSLTIDSEFLLGNMETAPIIADPENQEELVYKIQIGAYSKGLPAYVEQLFKKLSLIRKIENYKDENGVVVYTTGNLKNLEDAMKMKNQVRQEGVEDAFVVPYFNGKRITLEQAKKIEAGS